MTNPEPKPDHPLMLSALILVRVDREGGVPYISQDKIKDYLTEAVRLDIDREGVGDLDDDGHEVTALSIEWDTLQHGTIGESNWKCPGCGDNVTVKDRELEEIGTPMCGNCDLEMVEYAVNKRKCVRVEYDPNYHGGDYSGVGEFVYIPFDLVDEIKNPDGKAVMDDDRALKAAFEKATGLNNTNIIHYTFDEPTDQEGNQWDE